MPLITKVRPTLTIDELATPTGLVARVKTGTSVDIAWTDASKDEHGFDIERSEDESYWTAVTSVAENVNQYTNTGLSTDTTYYYRVRATMAGSKSKWSASANATPNTLVDDLIAYWSMDASGQDYAGPNHAIRVAGVVGTATGKVSNARQFTQSESDYQLLPDFDNLLSPGDTDFMLVGWVYLDSKITTTKGILSKYDGLTSDEEYTIDFNQVLDRLRFYVHDGASATIVNADQFGSVSTGTWYFIEAWHDSTGNEIGIRINRGTADTTAHTTGVQAGDAAFLFGARRPSSPANYMDGRLDEWGMWSRLLTSGELNTLYNSGSGYSSMSGLAKDINEQAGNMPGVWSWFTDPRVLRYNGQYYFGWVNREGDIEISQFADSDHPVRWYRMKGLLDDDDHATPSFLVRNSDKRVMVFYSTHGTVGNTIYMRISTNPEDISAMDSEVSLDTDIGKDNYTYTNPVQLLGEVSEPIYLYYREHSTGNAIWSYTKTTDDGANWSANQSVYEAATPANGAYLKLAQNGPSRIDFAVTNSHPATANGSIYHFYYEGGNYYKSDGTQIVTSLPFDEADATLVYDGSTNNSWIWDIAINNAGNPVIVFTEFQGGTTDHRYRYAIWDGSSWTDNAITAGGGTIAAPAANQPYYSGGIGIDNDNTSIVYLSKEVSGIHEIQKWTTSNRGVTWDSGISITSGSNFTNARPATVLNMDSIPAPIPLFWWYGDYDDYKNDFDTVIKIYRP